MRFCVCTENVQTRELFPPLSAHLHSHQHLPFSSSCSSCSSSQLITIFCPLTPGQTGERERLAAAVAAAAAAGVVLGGRDRAHTARGQLLTWTKPWRGNKADINQHINIIIYYIWIDLMSHLTPTGGAVKVRQHCLKMLHCGTFK